MSISDSVTNTGAVLKTVGLEHCGDGGQMRRNQRNGRFIEEKFVHGNVQDIVAKRSCCVNIQVELCRTGDEVSICIGLSDVFFQDSVDNAGAYPARCLYCRVYIGGLPTVSHR